MHQFGSLGRQKWTRFEIAACTCIVGAVALSLTGCSGAIAGGGAGAYAAAGSVSYCGSGYGSCSGGGGEFLLAAVVVGATIGAIVEIINWMCSGGR